MQFTRKTSSSKTITSLVIKLSFVIVIILGAVFLLSKVDFPAPKKEIEKIIPNENFNYYSEKVLYLPENQFTPMIDFTVGGWSLQVAMETVNIHAKYEFILPMSDVENLSNVSLKFINENDLKNFLEPVL